MTEKRFTKRQKKVMLWVLLVLAAGCCFLAYSLTKNLKPIESKKLTQGVIPYIHDDVTPESGGVLPENPRFVLYNMDTKKVYIPNPKYFTLGTDDPEQVNVIVAYRQVLNARYEYYDKEKKMYMPAYARDLVVDIIEKDNWKLIKRGTFEENGGSRNGELIDFKDSLRSSANEFICQEVEGRPFGSVVEQPAAVEQPAVVEEPAVDSPAVDSPAGVEEPAGQS